ncbi:MAG TPA: hypothetical protein VHZ51_27055 [Ktedonobacteraceae bacterium]|jgi:hypothetical protein|nr:hypothetical protein [Ktedonobacteraceae bacterium]
MAGYEKDILALIEGRDPKEHVFTRIPKNMDVQSYRRSSAQARYLQQAPDRALPSAEAERLRSTEYQEASRHMSKRQPGNKGKNCWKTATFAYFVSQKNPRTAR